MKTAAIKKTASVTQDGFAYLTKRIVVSNAKTLAKMAARKAMATMGFVVMAHKGWIVKKHADGLVEKIIKI